MSFTGLNTRGHQARQAHRKPPDDSWLITKRSDDKMLGPDLPTVEGVSWHQMTRSWYRGIRKSDVAQVYTETDWQSLLDAAFLKNAIVSGIGRNGKPLGHRDFQGYQTELRQKESALLLSPESRKRNKVVFVDPEPEVPRTNRSLNGPDYTAMFTGPEVTVEPLIPSPEPVEEPEPKMTGLTLEELDERQQHFMELPDVRAARDKKAVQFVPVPR